MDEIVRPNLSIQLRHLRDSEKLARDYEQVISSVSPSNTSKERLTELIRLVDIQLELLNEVVRDVHTRYEEAWDIYVNEEDEQYQIYSLDRLGKLSDRAEKAQSTLRDYYIRLTNVQYAHFRSIH